MSVFTKDRSNTDYVTLSGICKRTGAGESELAVFLLGQLIDNGLDFTESYTSATSVPGSIIIANGNAIDCRPQIYVDTKFDDEKRYFGIIVKNSNFGGGDSGFTEQRINSIFGNLMFFILANETNLQLDVVCKVTH
jgi:hypothetical protein